MNDCIKIRPEIAGQVIECLESRIASCDFELAAIDKGRTQAVEKRAALVATLAELRAAFHSIQASVSPNGEPRERRPKGHADKLLIEVVKAHPEGLRISDIERISKVNHATVYRTLHDPNRNKGRFVGIGRRWTLSEKNLGTSGEPAQSQQKTVNTPH